MKLSKKERMKLSKNKHKELNSQSASTNDKDQEIADPIFK
jgi:hypothetical protein